MIWFNKNATLDDLQSLDRGTLSEHIGIEWTELGGNFIKARMPVDQHTRQPYGVLHGGASCVLAETIGSIASALVVDNTRFYCFGIEINANHVRSVKEGFVTGMATPLHLGTSTHVWDIKIYDDQDRMICVSRLTVVVIPRKDQ